MQRASDASVPQLDLGSIQRVLEEAPVTVAVLYGSHARSEATSRSDVDIAVGLSESMSSPERTQARLDLIEQIGAELDVDAVDVVPLSGASESLLREIRADGILLRGTEDDVTAYGDPEPADDTHEDRMDDFDELLADLERVV